MKEIESVDMLLLRKAIESAWSPDTAYLFAEQEGNPALGQCYPTSRIVQFYFPEAEIVEGEVDTGTGNGVEKHFWNIFRLNDYDVHLDFSWQQFPIGSTVKNWKIRDRETLNDGEQTIERIEKLHAKVKQYLNKS